MTWQDIKEIPWSQEINCARLSERIIETGLRSDASDIHIEPGATAVLVRLRVDGLLQKLCELSCSLHSGLVSRFKIISGLDIAEKRVPQDGHIEMELNGRKVHIRISILPTVRGEKVVLRLFSKEEKFFTLEALNFSALNLKIYRDICSGRKGLVLLSGPTGSGKTAALYATLRELNDGSCNITTLEDPVEYCLQGINQTEVNKKTGLTFAGGLSAIVRQDPDVIMVGEIRDVETARISIQSALTGHAVFSTIHAGSASGIVERLLEMGLEPYLLAAAMKGAVAQRLVRRVCPCCGRLVEVSNSVKEYLRVRKAVSVKLYKGDGCSYCCDTGYKGRIAIHELLTFSEKICAMVRNKSTANMIESAAMSEGFIPMRQDGIMKVYRGLTTVEELWRAGIF